MNFDFKAHKIWKLRSSGSRFFNNYQSVKDQCQKLTSCSLIDTTPWLKEKLKTNSVESHVKPQSILNALRSKVAISRSLRTQRLKLDPMAIFGLSKRITVWILIKGKKIHRNVDLVVNNFLQTSQKVWADDPKNWNWDRSRFASCCSCHNVNFSLF